MNENLNKLNMFSVGRDLLRMLWVIVLAAVAVKLLAWSAITITFTPRYTSSATVAVTTGSMSTTYSDLSTAESMAEILSNVLDSDMMADVISQSLGQEDANVDFNVSLIENTNMLTMSVTAGDAKTAYQAMTAVMDNYQTVVADVVDNAVFHVIQQPAVAFNSVNQPNAKLPSTAAGGAAAIILVVVIILMSMRKPTLKHESMITSRLNATLLGSLPHEELNKSIKGKMKKINKGLLISNATVSFAFSERVRQLRSRIEIAAKDHDCKTILVTSVLENEGKSTVAANIALSLTQKGKKVLLVDADMRKPAIYKLMSLDPNQYRGIDHWLTEGDQFKSLVNWDERSKLWICAGSQRNSQSSELLGNPRMKEAVDYWRTQYDYVLLDVPPMTATVDSEILGNIADGIILVAREDRAPVDVLNEAISNLTRTNARFLGCVYNDAYLLEMTRIGHYGNHYGRSYGGGYGYGYSTYKSYRSYSSYAAYEEAEKKE